jgi:hypothetical protein
VLLFRTTIRVTSRGINSSPIAVASQRTGPTARFSLGLLARDSLANISERALIVAESTLGARTKKGQWWLPERRAL